MKKYLLQIRDSALAENALYTHFLGLCPALIGTASAFLGLMTGLFTACILTLSAAILSLLRKYLASSPLRIMATVCVNATLAGILDLCLRAFLPSLSLAMGSLIPFLAANCLIFGRMEGFALHHPPLEAVCDALGTGTGFLLTLTCVGVVREALGYGTILGGTALEIKIPLWSSIEIFRSSAGAFLLLGFAAALARISRQRKEQKQKRKEKLS